MYFLLSPIPYPSLTRLFSLRPFPLRVFVLMCSRDVGLIKSVCE